MKFIATNLGYSEPFSNFVKKESYEGKWGVMAANAMKRVAAGAHLPTPWLFEPARRPGDRADYCLDCSFLPQWTLGVLVFTL